MHIVLRVNNAITYSTPTQLAPLAIVAGGSKIGGSEGRLKERGAAGFARENEETTYNEGKAINYDRKGKGVEVRYFPRAREGGRVGRAMKCESARSGGGKSEAQYCTDSFFEPTLPLTLISSSRHNVNSCIELFNTYQTRF